MIQTILFLSTSSGPGGAERVISNLATSLDPARYRAVLCLFRQGWIQERSESRGVRTHIIPTCGMTDWRWALRFRRLLDEEHVDLIHAHEFDANVQGGVRRGHLRDSPGRDRPRKTLLLGKMQASPCV